MENKKTVAVTLRATEEMSEYLRVRAFETRTSKGGYIKALIEKDIEERNAETAK